MSSTVGASISTSFRAVIRGEYISSPTEEADIEPVLAADIEEEEEAEDEDENEVADIAEPIGNRGGGNGAALGLRKPDRGGPPIIDWIAGRRWGREGIPGPVTWTEGAPAVAPAVEAAGDWRRGEMTAGAWKEVKRRGDST